MMIRVFCVVACVVVSAGLLPAQAGPSVGQAEDPVRLFERRIGARADRILERLQLADAGLAAEVRHAVLRFYRALHAAHGDRELKLGALPAGDVHQIGRVQFNTDRQSHQVLGEFIGALARHLDESQVEAVKDWMTFDLLRLSVEEYQRMFPGMNERQKGQIRAWLVASREAALIAGSAETKLDVFRVNKMRLQAYLAVQGFDVESAVRAEEARKAAAKTAG